jgi:isopenicillin N synthase-like dioxygenase
MKGFALALDLPEEELHQQFTKPTSQIRLISYPARVPGAEQLGSEPHCDSGAFTILWQDETGGLEVHTRSGEWAAVVPIKGAFIVNIGDTLKVWTGGLFASTPHRVINRSSNRRQSIAYFANCDFDSELAAFPKFATKDSVSSGRYGDAILGFFQRFLGAAKKDLE